MYGAMIGDVVGSVYEWNNIKSKRFPLFQEACFPTDDSFMTVAMAQACMEYREGEKRDLARFQESLIREMHRIGALYPDKGYGERFEQWLRTNSSEPYGSYGNGSAMRVSPCGWVCDTLEETEALAEASAAVTHNHPEGIKGAKAAAAAVYLARTGHLRSEIGEYIREHYYPLEDTLWELRDSNTTFNATCQWTVPQAIEAFVESFSFENAIRNAISLGGDSDTIAAITGAIAEAYYGVPKRILAEAEGFLQRDMCQGELEIIEKFYKAYVAK